MIRGVHHVAISTPDLDRALGFYRDLLGFQEVQRVTWNAGADQIDRVMNLQGTAARQVMLKAGNLCLELFEFHSPTPRPADPERPVCDHGHTHICLDVTDIQEVYDRLVEAGVRFHCTPQDFGDVCATYGRDPDGNVFELQELLAPDDPSRVID